MPSGTDSEFTRRNIRVAPSRGGIKIDPNNLVLKGSSTLRARAAIARGEELAEQGRYYDAIIGQYQRALGIQPNRPLANFRMGEAFFYQKKLPGRRELLPRCPATVPEPSEKWNRSLEPRLSRQNLRPARASAARAVNEYSKAKQTNDDTGSAQQVAESLLKKAYVEGAITAAGPSNGAPPGAAAVAPKTPPADDRPVLKKRTDTSPN